MTRAKERSFKGWNVGRRSESAQAPSGKIHPRGQDALDILPRLLNRYRDRDDSTCD